RIPSGATPTLVRGSPGVRVISGPSPAVVLSSAPTFPWVPVTAAACVTLLVAAGLAALTVYLPREEKQPQPAAGPLAWLVRDSKSSRPLDAATRPLVAVRLEPQGAAARPQPAPPAPAPPSAAVPAVAPPPAPPPAPRLARRAGESNLAWLTREPESRAAFQACLASEADRLSIEAILSPRQRQSAAVAALLARLKMEFGETSAVAPLVRGALDRSANGLLVPQDIRDLMDEVCRWLGDVTLLTETAPVLPTEVSGIEPSLRRGRHLLGKRDAVGALEVYRALVESGYPEAGVWLPRAVAHLVAGDSFGAALDSRLYLANPGMERGKTVAVFVFSEAVGTLGSRRLAARARVELASLPLPPSQLQELLEWDRRLVERSREKPSDSVDDLPVSAVLLEGPAGKDEWAARGWPLKAFEALAESPDAERVANGPELFPRLYRFLSGP
ncbi:MAG: hypothetical protein HY303_19560, partial [Candidatus Wallbacteria bacterium]|nr:hypothetical protein [Candidatus Wallbacteria bacterium]